MLKGHQFWYIGIQKEGFAMVALLPGDVPTEALTASFPNWEIKFQVQIELYGSDVCDTADEAELQAKDISAFIRRRIALITAVDTLAEKSFSETFAEILDAYSTRSFGRAKEMLAGSVN